MARQGKSFRHNLSSLSNHPPSYFGILSLLLLFYQKIFHSHARCEKASVFFLLAQINFKTFIIIERKCALSLERNGRGDGRSREGEKTFFELTRSNQRAENEGRKKSFNNKLMATINHLITLIISIQRDVHRE